MNMGDKILGKHMRRFLHKNNVQLGSLTFQSYKTVLQFCKTTAKKDEKRAARANFVVLLIRKKSVLHVQFVFLLIRSIDLDAIFIALRITRFNFFCLQVFLTRASLLALAKSIYYRCFENETYMILPLKNDQWMIS